MKYTVDEHYSTAFIIDKDGDLSVTCTSTRGNGMVYIPACDVPEYARRMIQFFTPLAKHPSCRGTFED